MRILVTGSNGLLGTKVLERLLHAGPDAPLAASRGAPSNGYLGDVPFWRMDVTDATDVAATLDAALPDAVIHTAALTDVDGCERERDAAEAINAGGAGNVARGCAERGIRLVHLSTEYVFDGAAGPYREDDPINPLGWYARTKAEGEQAVRAAGGSWAIARTTVLYGYAPHVRANFVLWLVGKLRAGERVRIVEDQIGSPTLADNLADMTLALARTNAVGVFNTVGADVLSRYEFARRIAAAFDLDASLIEPIPTASLNQLAPRPLRAGLLMDHFRMMFPDVPVLGVNAGIAELKRQVEASGQ
ncbi:MAG: dTDP-4-dehydrorhamnose reductase [Chloroflexi bacterium]|nr:dTDP-4-dehydrorhamnose reductase [Chloroflexota bacterium]